VEFNSRISVFGGRVIQDSLYEKIIKIGEMLAKENYLTFCGGGKGVMEAIAKGVTNKKGVVIGILSEQDYCKGNKFLSIPIATGVGMARNALLAYNCDAAIAIAGGDGTLSEIAFAKQLNKPVIGYNTFNLKGLINAENCGQIKSILEKVCLQKKD
tara:strand:- start:139 stop:606 length:468 start_codon:yes stop_codon:yes gene_type:complete